MEYTQEYIYLRKNKKEKICIKEKFTQISKNILYLTSKMQYKIFNVIEIIIDITSHFGSSNVDTRTTITYTSIK